METIAAQQVDADELAQLEAAAAAFDGKSRIGATLTAMAEAVRAGSDVVVAARASQLTPSQAAGLIGMSRTHLYKVMDRGDLPFVRVGRDRRIAFTDLVAFWQACEGERRTLAERFAHRDAAREALVQRLAGVDSEQARRVGY